MKITQAKLRQLITEELAQMNEQKDPMRGSKELIETALRDVQDTIERQAPTGMTARLDQDQFVALVQQVLMEY